MALIGITDLSQKLPTMDTSILDIFYSFPPSEVETYMAFNLEG